MVKYSGWLHYYRTLLLEAHGAAKGHWTRVFWIGGYVVAFVVPRVPSVSDQLDKMPEVASVAARYGVIGLLIVLAVARVNWLRVKTLQAQRTTRITFMAPPQVVYRAEYVNPSCGVLLEIMNPGTEPVMFERTWFLELYDDTGAKLGEYEGSARNGIKQLPGNDRFQDVWLTFAGGPSSKHVVGRAVVRGTDIHDNRHTGEWVRSKAVVS